MGFYGGGRVCATNVYQEGRTSVKTSGTKNCALCENSSENLSPCWVLLKIRVVGFFGEGVFGPNTQIKRICMSFSYTKIYAYNYNLSFGYSVILHIVIMAELIITIICF